MDVMEKEETYTIDDIYNLPDGERAELILYHAAGVREYWIVDPEKHMTSVYSFERNQVEQYFFGEEIPVGIYKGFSIPCIPVYT